ncbi:MAG TPA: hypothetical protein VFZ79_07610 [Acidimicrobiales bacterium]
MTIDTTCPGIPAALGGAAGLFDDDLVGAGPADARAAEGWQVLALAELGRPLTEAEAAATERLAAEHVVDLLFPGLSDAARHEVLSALG